MAAFDLVFDRVHFAGRFGTHQARLLRSGLALRRLSQAKCTGGRLNVMESILVINAGSSSLKFQIYGITPDCSIRQLVFGQLDGIGSKPRLRASGGGPEPLDIVYKKTEVADLPAAIDKVRGFLRTIQGLKLRAIGHRVVHGGPVFDKPVVIDRAVLEQLASYQDLAPLHQPNNLASIRLAMDMYPTVPQVACFDTAFHRGHMPHVDCYALPRRFYEEGVRRYGFHGLSYEYVAQRLCEIASDLARERVIVAHLGSGASMCALKHGRSIESTMGFTALDGLVMGTRPGQLDPGVVLHLISKEGLTADSVANMLYRDSGLKGLSGISNDMRDLLASSDANAGLAIEHFVHRAALNAGMLAAALGGLDGFVFTAGIGENSPAIRAMISERLAWLGAILDQKANEEGACLISTQASRVRLHVIATNEELMIAKHTLALVNA